MNPEAHALGLINWDLFCSNTLPNNLQQAGTGRLGSVVFAWLRYVAEASEIHFKHLLWCSRSEKGEKTHRLHYHFLLGGIPCPSLRLRFALKNKWEALTWNDNEKRGSMARVFPFNDGLSGVGYILKDGVAYESGKFREAADVVTVSNSVHTVARRTIQASSQATALRPLRHEKNAMAAYSAHAQAAV